ncbi:16S rRNA (cytidine(1402)-2'-O)-methyltransferase [Erythrobacter sp. HL-111]|uniref:16S rRNA (cytidine(1402)-2'-O)-methyltransferase n=1 Tax=Erythrobacter sp. HL-111 TaxID=1798193 RepID=UPI0006DBC476|nr:16S rRNA (cytidine(1402)-2'-O)-methyltransferase [Erythrobacter sp. HL-111]KPP86395.1 MAG: 16S rRNA (cytidine(1402)-2'-O)-methyltransferase RsmI [Erythrobacteraceae bacterium HL-111]SDR93963.1 16S rRNA (cytidine1402-2'-O)-methyltransferase [Erythrobacter sp. HL-111]
MAIAYPDPSSETPSEPLGAGLYIVATPIGNLGDITLRAIDVLRRATLVACEDTRVTGRLLKAVGAHTRMQRYDDYASDETRRRILDRAHGEAVALVSDAGTPLVSDPGYRLVREARAAGIAVTTIPGPCAAIAGLTLAGLPSDRFLFGGFLPVRDKARREVLEELGAVESTLIFYETGPRLVRSLEAMALAWPGRTVAVARELTKLHEECRPGSAAELAAHYRDHPAKGEIVLLVGPPVAGREAADPDALLAGALEDMSPSKAAASVAKATGLDRKALYARALELKAR